MACPSITQVVCAPLTMLNLTNVQNHLGFKWWGKGGSVFWLVCFFFFFPSFLRRVRDFVLWLVFSCFLVRLMFAIFILRTLWLSTWILHICLTFIPYLSRNLLMENLSVFQKLCKALGLAFFGSKMKWSCQCNKTLAVLLLHVLLLKLPCSKFWLKAVVISCREMLQRFWFDFV